MALNNQVFVISPIGDDASATRARADDILEYIIKPAVESQDLALMRSDKDPTPGQVTSRLLRSILESRVIIADLTGRNPNVYYELGVVHSFARPVVILVDKASSLTFDTQNERVIEIRDDGKIGAQEAARAKGELLKALAIVLKEGYKPSSIVTEVAGAQSLSALAPENPVASELSSLSEKVDQVLHRLAAAAPRPSDYTISTTSVLAIPIEDLDLTVRSYNVLKRAGINVVGELLTYSEQDLAQLRNLGEKNILEIKLRLRHLGLRLRQEGDEERS